MNKRIAPVALALAIGLPLALAPATAFAAGGDGTYNATLTPLNGSGATGTASLTLKGDQLTVVIDAHGLTANAPHAQHIHGTVGGHNVCPTMAADKDGNGFVSTSEGTPAYGAIDVSLTTTGDSSPKSALAVDRFPMADANGDLHYERTLTVSSDVANNLGSLHVVQHGVDENNSGKYDGDTKSDLDPSLPAEATDPTDCGMLVSASTSSPNGGVQTGGGGASGGVNDTLVAFGGLALVGAGASIVVARRRATAQS